MEADEALRRAGFCGDALSEEAVDDSDGCICPPSRVSARGGGVQLLARFGDRASLVNLSTIDKDTGVKISFACAHEVMNGIFFAQMAVDCEQRNEAVATQQAVSVQSMKAGITTLLDVAESCGARKITLGLSHQNASCAELVCSLLYLGFEVAPARKFPLIHAVLQLDFDVGWPPQGVNVPTTQSEQTCTGTSECSTSAEDVGTHNASDGTDSE